MGINFAMHTIKFFTIIFGRIIFRHIYLSSISFFHLLFSLCVFDKTCVVWVFEPRTFLQKCFSFGFWVSAYGRLHGSCYRVLSNPTSVRCRSACMSHDVLPLRVRHTADIGIRRLVGRLFALLSMYPIGDTADSVPSLLCPNIFAPTASDTIS